MEFGKWDYKYRMKNTLIIAILCLGIGFATAWFVKPSSEATDLAQNDAAQKSNRKASARGASDKPAARPSRKPSSSSRVQRSDEELSPEMQKSMQEAQDREKERARVAMKKKFDQRIANIVRELGLNGDQEKALRAFFDKKLDQLDIDDPEELMNDPAKLKEMADAMRGKGMREHMKEFLSEDQLVKLDALEKRKHKNKVEGRAMKDLAKLQQNMDLTEDQKNDVYGVLLRDAEDSVKNQSDADLLMRSYMEGMGMGIDMGDEDLGVIMQLQSLGDDANPLEAIKEIQAERQKTIDARVENMAAVMDESQLKQYRSHLENQGGMMRMMMQGIEGMSEPGDAEGED